MHIVNRDLECPEKTMEFYYEKTDFKKGFRGNPRTVLATTLSEDIRRTKKIPIERLTPKEDLKNIHKLAENREGW